MMLDRRIASEETYKGMIAPLAKLMDWWAIQYVAMMLPANACSNPKLEEAIQCLKGPDFVPTASHPAQVEFKRAPHP